MKDKSKLLVSVYKSVNNLLKNNDNNHYALFQDKWYITKGEAKSNLIKDYSIWLYKGKEFIDCFNPFIYAKDYAELASGKQDLILETSVDIIETIEMLKSNG